MSLGGSIHAQALDVAVTILDHLKDGVEQGTRTRRVRRTRLAAASMRGRRITGPQKGRGQRLKVPGVKPDRPAPQAAHLHSMQPTEHWTQGA